MPILNYRQSSQSCHWHSFATAAEVEQAALAEILRHATQAINARGAFHFVLAGGTTPQKVYELLRNVKTNWTPWHIYFGDERCLPIGAAERNSLMAAEVWLNHVAIPPAQIHAIPAELGAVIAAQKYAKILHTIETFDLVLLGLGEDGHTASLFPGQDAGDAADAPPTLAVFDAPKPPPERVSLSAQRLSRSHNVLFLVTGAAKKQAVHEWRNGIAIPASKISLSKPVEVYCDAHCGIN